jgi:hypothetical protein
MAYGKTRQGRPRKSATAATKATRTARMTKAAKKIPRAASAPSKKMQDQQRSARCGARDEEDDEPCDLQASKTGFCEEHSHQWDRSAHLRAGMPTLPDDEISNFDTCGKQDCKAKSSVALECEACPFTYHPQCTPEDSRMVKNTNGEQVFVCGTCVNDPLKWSMIPLALREAGIKKKRQQADKNAVDAFLDKASPPKKPDDDDRVSKRKRSDSTAATKAVNDKLRQSLLEQLDRLHREEELADKTEYGQSDTDIFVDSSDDDGKNGVAPSMAPAIKNAITASLELQDSLQHNRRFAHHDNQCNDPDCKINHRDGQFDFNAGDRIDGAYESLALNLFGPSSCSAWSSSQRPTIEAEQKARGCSKPSFNKPTFSNTCTLSDSQVNTYLEDTAAAYTSLARERATLGYACQTRLDLIVNVKTTAAAVRTILTRPDTYGGMSAQDYVRMLLELAHRGADVHSANIYGIPRHDVTSCLSLKKSSSAGTSSSLSSSKHDANAQKNNNGGGGGGGGGNGGDGGGNNNPKNNKKQAKLRCYNCEKYHGGTPGTSDHNTAACTKAWKLVCGINGCKETHKRKDHK